MLALSSNMPQCCAYGCNETGINNDSIHMDWPISDKWYNQKEVACEVL